MIDIDALRVDVRARAERIAIALLGDPSDRSGAELRFPWLHMVLPTTTTKRRCWRWSEKSVQICE